MLSNLYFLLCSITVIFTLLSFFIYNKKIKIPIWVVWLPFILASSVAAVSGAVETQYCEPLINTINTSVSNISNYTYSWSCHLERYEATPLIWFWGAYSGLMFLYALFSSFQKSFDLYERN